MSMIQRMIDTEVNIMISKCNLKVLSPPFCDIEIVVIYVMYKSYKFRKGKSENISLRVYIDSKDKYSMFIYNTV